MKFSIGNLEKIIFASLAVRLVEIWYFCIIYLSKMSIVICWTNIFYFVLMKWTSTYSGTVIWQLDLQLPMQSVPITTKVVSSNHAHGEVYSIQQYSIKYVSDLRQVGGFLQVLRFPPSIQLTANGTMIKLKYC